MRKRLGHKIKFGNREVLMVTRVKCRHLSPCYIRDHNCDCFVFLHPWLKIITALIGDLVNSVCLALLLRLGAMIP